MGLGKVFGEQIPSAALPFWAASSVIGGQDPKDVDYSFFFSPE